jgi:hypothetical protein
MSIFNVLARPCLSGTSFEIRSIIRTRCLSFIAIFNELKHTLIIMEKTLSATPLHDRVIVKPAPAEEKTAGGIIIPDTAKEKPQRGTIIAAGSGEKKMNQ